MHTWDSNENLQFCAVVNDTKNLVWWMFFSDILIDNCGNKIYIRKYEVGILIFSCVMLLLNIGHEKWKLANI